MNQHPRSIVAEGIESALRVIVGAQPGKEDLIFSQWSEHAVGYAISEGMDKVPVIDRLHQAGTAIGLGDTFIQVCLSSAVERAEEMRLSGAVRRAPPVVFRQPDNSERSLVVQCAAAIKPEAIEWIWRHRIALAKLWLIAGEPGLGKSQLASMIAATITTGGDWPCGEGRAKQGSVIMLCAEDGAADTIVPRLMAAGADLSRVHIVSAVAGGDRQGNRSFNLQADLDLLESCLARIKDVRLIVIDPISSYMGKVDSHKNTDVRNVLEAVGEMAGRHRVALLGITHFSKGGGQKAINQFIGSIAFIAAARTAYAVMADPDDDTRRLFMPVKNNLAPLGQGLAFRMEQRLLAGDIVASSICFDSNPVHGTADAMLAANAGNGDDRSALSEAADFLEQILAQGPQPVTKIKADAEQADVSWATIRRAKKRSNGRIEKDRVGGLGSDGHWVWFLSGPWPKTLNNS